MTTVRLVQLVDANDINPDGGRCLTGDRDGPRRHQPECPVTGN